MSYLLNKMHRNKLCNKILKNKKLCKNYKKNKKDFCSLHSYSFLHSRTFTILSFFSTLSISYFFYTYYTPIKNYEKSNLNNYNNIIEIMSNFDFMSYFDFYNTMSNNDYYDIIYNNVYSTLRQFLNFNNQEVYTHEPSYFEIFSFNLKQTINDYLM